MAGETPIVVGGRTFWLVAGRFETAGASGIAGDVAAPDGVEPVEVWKTVAMVRALQAVVDQVAPRRILELGVADGGGTALLAAMAPEATVAAVELDADRAVALDDHIARHDLGGRVRPRYGVDQADRAALRRVVADELRGGPLDLVVDDASHGYEASLASFDALFPLVRPGGCYAIEDWSWGHLDLRGAPPAEVRFPPGPPLSKLVFELLMVLGAFTDVIARIDADASTVRVWRGDAPIDPDRWSVAAARRLNRPITFA